MTSSDSRWTRVNAEFWRAGRTVPEYANRTLLPVETIILCRYHEAVAGRVIELGCGAGRLLGYLADLANEAHGLDVSPTMVSYCARTYPTAKVRVGEIAALDAEPSNAYDAVFAIDNVIDVFDHAHRQRVLGDIRELIAPGGILVFSSHNLDSLHRPGGNSRLRRASGLLRKLGARPLSEVLTAPRRVAVRVRNRRRLAPLQRRESGYAIVNDQAHDYALLHYYVGRDEQERQLGALGYELLDCLDVNGRSVPRGESSAEPWLHYVARPVN